MGAVAADPVHSRRCTPAPAATSPRTSAPTCARSKAPDHIGILVALKDRQNALKNPYAHLHEHDITFDSIKDSMMLWDPIRYAETCPSSRRRLRAWCSAARPSATPRADGPVAGVDPGHGHALASRRCRPTATRCCRSVAAECAADVYQQAGITDPRREVDCVEMYVPFSWFEPMWLENLGFAEPGRGLEAGRGRRHRSSTATCR